MLASLGVMLALHGMDAEARSRRWRHHRPETHRHQSETRTEAAEPAREPRKEPAVKAATPERRKATESAPPPTAITRTPAPLPRTAVPAPAAAAPAPPPAPPAEPPPPRWSAEDVIRARGECMARLAPIVAQIEPLPPLDENHCGAPAPVRLKSIGGLSRVEFRPPVIVNCPMVAALHEWLNAVVEPEAERTLGTHIVGIGSAGGYQCRNRAGEQKVSEHAAANAVDVLEFVTARGEIIDVARKWGPIVLHTSQLAGRTPAQAFVRRAPGADDPSPTDGARRHGDEKQATTNGRVKRGAKQSPDADAEPGARGAAGPSMPPEAELGPEALFLRPIHDEACAQFRTVLGPNANRDHWNHFHLDLEERRNKSHYCR